MKIDIIKNDTIKEEIHFKELANGLKVFFMPKKNYVKKYAIFSTKYGSNDNKFVPIGEDKAIDVPEGIAHFLEHKLFEEPDGNIFDEFSKLGSYVNAFTNFNQTSYLFECTDRFNENLEMLVKFVQNPYFTDENVEKEKGIIEQEIRMYEDTAYWKVFFNCLRGMYNNHPVRIDIAGTVDSIKRINKEVLYKCYDTFYHPRNMILFMIGDIDYEKAIETVERVQSDKFNKNLVGEIQRIYSKEDKNIKESLIEEKLSISTPLFNIGFKDTDVGYDGKRFFEKEIATNIILEILFGESSEFYQELYNEGLINNTFGAQYVGYRDYGHSILGGESDRPKEVAERVIEHIKKVKIKGLSSEDFDRIKRKMTGNLLANLNSIEYIANKFTSYYFINVFFTDYIDILENIDFTKIDERFRQHFLKDNSTLSIINPI